jgi:hypothetical protein
MKLEVPRSKLGYSRSISPYTWEIVTSGNNSVRLFDDTENVVFEEDLSGKRTPDILQIINKVVSTHVNRE